jgi:hypothetical protein
MLPSLKHRQTIEQFKIDECQDSKPRLQILD